MEEEQFAHEEKSLPANTSLKAQIIIPTLNEGQTIGNLIHDIRNHILPLNTSILVIDGGSTDNIGHL